ncbi:thymidylate synthase [Actinoallomurus sp. NPDC050550]|uniref:thymidylate synthase n=1 Tax=Actinoallomurus sp. NPDC050550 TaxID=3154937 RepID=UPI0033CD822E
MLQIPAFTTFHDAYLAVLRHVSEQHEYRNAPRGNAARECLNVSFTLTDPRERIIYVPARRTNIVFCFAEALWYLSGRDDLEMISYYAPRLARFSADGETLTGSAYGPKLLRPTHTGRSQWERVLNLLAEDPASKRAVVSFFEPEELIDAANPDVSCTLALQFLLRNGHLHAVTYMRGNDAVIGLVSDVFAFTLIQEFTAHQLGAQVGSYSHHVGSMHINDVDAERVAAIVATTHGTQAWFPAKAMPPTRWTDLKIVARFEEALRRDEEQLDPGDQGWLGLDPFWQQVVLLFETHRQIVHHPGQPIWPSTLQALDPGYRWLVAHRWPERIPEGFPIPAGGER